MLGSLRRTLLSTPAAYTKLSSNMATECSKIAVVLSGCGYLDGSEIHEAVSVLSHLTRNNAEPFCYALDCKQHHVIDHARGDEDSSHCRHIISEASRIARHPVKPLEMLIKESCCYNGIIFPGGFGVAKNFSDFAEKADEMTIHPHVQQVLEMFYCDKKPIGLICIAPILAAKLFPGVRITLGQEGDGWPYKDAITAARKMGGKMEMRSVDEVTADYDHMVFSTPAFMYDGDYHEVDDGIGRLVKAMLVSLKFKTSKKEKTC